MDVVDTDRSVGRPTAEWGGPVVVVAVRTNENGYRDRSTDPIKVPIASGG